MRPISATGKPHRTDRTQQGFTLLELLLTLGLAALIASLTLPALRTSPVVELRNAAQTVAAALRQTRLTAMQQGQYQSLSVDTRLRKLAGVQTRELDKNLHLKLSTAKSLMQNEHTGSIRFWPDGSASGGRVTLRQEQLSVRVDVEWLTGRIRISEVEGG